MPVTEVYRLSSISWLSAGQEISSPPRHKAAFLGPELSDREVELRLPSGAPEKVCFWSLFYLTFPVRSLWIPKDPCLEPVRTSGASAWHGAGRASRSPSGALPGDTEILHSVLGQPIWEECKGGWKTSVRSPAYQTGDSTVGIKTLTFLSLWVFSLKDPLFLVIKRRYEEKPRWKNRCDVFNTENIEHHQKRTSMSLQGQVSRCGFGRCTIGWAQLEIRLQSTLLVAPRSWEESIPKDIPKWCSDIRITLMGHFPTCLSIKSPVSNFWETWMDIGCDRRVWAPSSRCRNACWEEPSLFTWDYRILDVF